MPATCIWCSFPTTEDMRFFGECGKGEERRIRHSESSSEFCKELFRRTTAQQADNGSKLKLIRAASLHQPSKWDNFRLPATGPLTSRGFDLQVSVFLCRKPILSLNHQALSLSLPVLQVSQEQSRVYFAFVHHPVSLRWI
mmetsp:Transcript_11685/g.32365  ORF Transcript_11685/g.32365 Transcript_11685/m.32365 type:complete len:140 (-) Transcript_11685:606-1025(-)